MTWLLAMLGSVGMWAGTNTGAENNKIVVASDIHVMAPSLLPKGAETTEAWTTYYAGQRKMLQQSAAIFDQFVTNVLSQKPTAVFIAGDLTKDGEKDSHQYVKNGLITLRENGIKAFVIPGNHDFDGAGAPTQFNADGTTSDVDALAESEFADFYTGFGYGDENSEYDPNSLSYVAEPMEGLALLAIDSHTASISEKTLEWLYTKATEKRNAGKQVIAMMHHPLFPHITGANMFIETYNIKDYEDVRDSLINAGVNVILTGHFHTSDIAKDWKDDEGKAIYDINTGSLISYPCDYRILTRSADKATLDVATASIVPTGMTADECKTWLHARMKSIATKKMNDKAGAMAAMAATYINNLAEFAANLFILHAEGDENASTDRNGLESTYTTYKSDQMYKMALNIGGIEDASIYSILDDKSNYGNKTKENQTSDRTLTIDLPQTSTFKYTAKEKLTRFEEILYFVGAKSVISHTFDEAMGEGTVVYEGTVTALGSNALLFNSELTGIVIPEGVTKLGFQSFKGCSKLTNITLPKSLTATENLVFDGCSGLAKGKLIVDDLAWWCSINWGGPYSTPLFYAKHLYSDEDTEITNLVIPEGVANVGAYAFYHCEGITSVSFPSTLESIGSNAFAYTGLTSVDIPVGFTEIGECAFQHCANLISVTIPEGVTKIGNAAFVHTGLTSLTLPSTITSMMQSFYRCENLATLTLKDGITTLGESFYSCPALTSVNIPGSVKEIGSSDFKGCTGLTTVTLNEGTEEVSFDGCTNLETINFPSTVKKVYFRNCGKLETVTLQEGVERISSFDGCSALKQINIPSTVTYVGTFRYCTALEKVIVADLASWCAARHYDSYWYGPQKMAGKLYLGTVESNEEITNLVIPEGVTKIADGAFIDVTGITSIVLPSTLVTWENSAFNNCTGVEDVYCRANPVMLSWSGSENNFKEAKATLMHVADADAWTAKFPNANVTFVGGLGDANGDDKTDIADVAELVNKLLDQPSATFNEVNADVDGDGKVTVADLEALVSIILVK